VLLEADVIDEPGPDELQLVQKTKPFSRITTTATSASASSGYMTAPPMRSVATKLCRSGIKTPS
jgi:hypothetical protein